MVLLSNCLKSIFKIFYVCAPYDFLLLCSFELFVCASSLLNVVLTAPATLAFRVIISAASTDCLIVFLTVASSVLLDLTVFFFLVATSVLLSSSFFFAP